MMGEEYHTERERQQRALDALTGWQDRSYSEAVASARGPVILGPVACGTCRAWVEYAGGAWVGLGSDQLHECAPFMEVPAEAHHSVAALLREHPWGQRRYEEAQQPTVVTARLGDFYQAHELPEDEPVWVEVAWRPIWILAAFLVGALAVAMLARWAGG